MMFLSAPHRLSQRQILSGHEQVKSVSLVPAFDPHGMQHIHFLSWLVWHSHPRELTLQLMIRKCHQPYPRTQSWHLLLLFVLIHFRFFLSAVCCVWKGVDQL